MRIRGVIDRDQTWSGHVLLTDDVRIESGQVTVNPGTTIEFAQAAPNTHPVLTVTANESGLPRLILQGSPDKPIRIRTLTGTQAGRIVAKFGAGLGKKHDEAPTAILWQHVHFERLGFERTAAGRKVTLIEPALAVDVWGRTGFELRQCSFDGCSRVAVVASAGASLVAVRNRFDHGAERTNLELTGDPGVVDGISPILVQGNQLDGCLLLRAGAAKIENNVLIGPHAAVVIDANAAAATTVRRNYVHNTTLVDDGHYCLNCESPDVLVTENVFRGGTSCVLTAPRRMSGNVLIGAPKLSSKVVRSTPTHNLLQALPIGAVFEGNLLLGPAHCLLVAQPLLTARADDSVAQPTIIRQNLFDGFGKTARAVQVGTPGRPPATLELYNNVFLRAPGVVFSESVSRSTLKYADFNAMAPRPGRPYENIFVGTLEYGTPGWGSGDVIKDEPSALGLQTPPPLRIEDFDRPLQSGEMTTSQVRERLLRAYRLRPESPLIGRGRTDDTDQTESGPPIIGPTETKP